MFPDWLIKRAGTIQVDDTLVVDKEQDYTLISTTTTSALKSFSLKGTIRIESVGERGDQCKQVANFEVNISLMGFGGLVEKAIASGMADTYAKMGALVETYKKDYLEAFLKAGKQLLVAKSFEEKTATTTLVYSATSKTTETTVGDDGEEVTTSTVSSVSASATTTKKGWW